LSGSATSKKYLLRNFSLLTYVGITRTIALIRAIASTPDLHPPYKIKTSIGFGKKDNTSTSNVSFQDIARYMTCLLPSPEQLTATTSEHI